jgi:hypothetical protein
MPPRVAAVPLPRGDVVEICGARGISELTLASRDTDDPAPFIVAERRMPNFNPGSSEP